MAEDDDIAAGTPQSSSNHRVNSLGDVPGLQCRLVSHAHNEQDEGAATPTRTASTNEEHIREAPLFHLAQPPCASPRSSSPDANHGGLTTSLSISHPVVKFLTTLELQGYASYIIHENQLDTMELLSESASSADLAAKLLGPTSSHRQQAELSKGLQRWIKQQQREEAARQREAQRAGAAAARKGGRRAKKMVAAEDVVNGAAELLPTADPNHDRKRGRGEEEEGAGKAGDSSAAPSARTFRRENETATQFMRKLAFPGKLPPPASPPTQGGTQSIPIDVDAEEDEDDVAPAIEDALMRWMQQEEHPAAVAPQDEDSHRPALLVGSPAQTQTNTESAMSSALLSWLSGEDVVDRHVSCSRDPLWLLSVGLEQRQAPTPSVGAFASSAAQTASALEAELADIPDPTRSPAKIPSSPASAEIPSETSLPPQSAEDLPIAMRLTYSDHEDEIQHSRREVSVNVEERVSELQEDLRRNMTALLTTYQEKMDELLLQGNGKDAVLSTHTSRLRAILQPMRDDDEERVISRVWMVGHSSVGTTTTMEPSPLTCESRLLPSHLPTQAEMVDAQLPSSQLTSLVRSPPPVMHTSADCHLKDREDEAGISNHQDDGDDDWWDQLGIEGLQPTQNTFDDATAEDSCNMTIGRCRGESPSILPANISSVVVEAPLPSGEDDSLLVATQHIATRDVAHMSGKAMMNEDMKSDALNDLLHLYHSQKLHSLPAEEVVVLCASLGLALHEHTEEGVEAMRSALLHAAVRGCFYRQVAPQCLHRLPRFSGLPYYPVKVGDLLAAHDDAPRAEEQWATLRAEATMEVEAENRRCILASVFATSVEAIEKQCCTDYVGSLDGTTLPLGDGENEEAAHTAESSTSAPSGMFECTPALTAGDAMLLLEPVELESLVALVTRDFPHLSSSKIKSALQESGVVMSCVRHLPQTASPLANTTRTRGWGSGSPHRVRSPSRSRSMTDDTVPLSQAEKVQERKRLFFATRGMPTRRGFIGRGRARGRGGGAK